MQDGAQMFDAAAMLGLEEVQRMLFRAVYVEKRLSKHQLRDVSIVEIIARLQTGTVSVRMAGTAVLGLAKILGRKLRYLQEDCSEAVHQICQKMERSRSFRSQSVRGITLVPELDGVYIDDEMVDPGEFIVAEEPAGPDFEDFHDLSYVEQMRLESDAMSGLTDATQIQMEPREKRRRTMVDLECEFDPQRFRENLRNTRDIVHREQGVDVENMFVSRLAIAPEILSRFRGAVHPRESVEGIRDMTATDSYMDLDVHHTLVSEDDFGEALDLGSLPAEFVFNEVVAEKTALERSRCFLSLLGLLGRGEVRAEQEQPFSRIVCRSA